ncbi:MAG: hypothetical protein ACLPPF_00870 [Rhodomicrobium sp.]
MQTDTALSELLEGIRAIFAQDLTGKPKPRNKAVADPALWRAIQTQQKNANDGQCWFRDIQEK